MISFADPMLKNQFSFKHSSLNFPLKLSMKALSEGLPGRIKFNLILFYKGKLHMFWKMLTKLLTKNWFSAKNDLSKSGKSLFYLIAEGGTRTPKGLLPLDPEPSVFANFTTPA